MRYHTKFDFYNKFAFINHNIEFCTKQIFIIQTAIDKATHIYKRATIRRYLKTKQKKMRKTIRNNRLEQTNEWTNNTIRRD